MSQEEALSRRLSREEEGFNLVPQGPRGPRSSSAENNHKTNDFSVLNWKPSQNTWFFRSRAENNQKTYGF